MDEKPSVNPRANVATAPHDRFDMFPIWAAENGEVGWPPFETSCTQGELINVRMPRDVGPHPFGG